MKPPVFKLEEYFAAREFSTPYLLCSSDAESVSVRELVAMADGESRTLWEEMRLGYTEVPGMPLLRAEIAALYDGLDGQDVLCFAGAEEGIFCAATALLSKGDHAVVVTPCYQSLEELPRWTGAGVTTVALQEREGWRLDVEALKAAMTPATRMLLINFPHNPTGSVIDRTALEALVALCRERGIYLFSDEVYRFLGVDEAARNVPPVAALYEKGLSLGVMSKALGLAGLRIGWVASRDREALKKLEQVKHYTTICNSAPSEILALMALRAKDKLLARNNEIAARNITLVDAFMARHAAAFSWVRPQGGCTGFVRYHGPETAAALADNLAEAAGVLILPGEVYGNYEQHFRLGFGRHNMPEALARMEGFLEGKRVAA